MVVFLANFKKFFGCPPPCVQVWEQRVSSLEARLSELSHTVGKYDREKEQDTLNIQLRATSSYCTSVASHTVGCVYRRY